MYSAFFALTQHAATKFSLDPSPDVAGELVRKGTFAGTAIAPH